MPASVKTVHRRAPHRRPDRLAGQAATSGTTTRWRRRRSDCPPSRDERRGPALHPLHLGLDRQAQGRAAHHRRLSRLHRDDASIRLRLSRRRHLLVHGRCRLGHRAQLHRLRAARQRRDDADVRGRAELSRRLALLAGDRQAQGQHLLHRADRDPRADARGRGAGQEDLAQIAAAAGLGRRADQSRGVAVVSPRRRRQPRADRRHLVADRDRRHPDHAAARRHRAEARLGDASRSSASSRCSSTTRATCSRARPRAISASPSHGRARCAPSMATTSASSRPISRPSRASISPATARAATRTAITGSPAASTTSSTSPATASAPPRSRARWWRIRRSPRPRSSAIRTTSRARASTPMSP